MRREESEAERERREREREKRKKEKEERNKEREIFIENNTTTMQPTTLPKYRGTSLIRKHLPIGL